MAACWAAVRRGIHEIRCFYELQHPRLWHYGAEQQLFVNAFD